MMIRRRILTAFAVVMITVSGLVGVAWHGSVYAAQTATVSGDALKVSPVRWDLEMDPGTTKVVDLFIQNLTSVPARLHPAINDFTASADESGKPSVILDEDKFAPNHSLKRFAQPMADITVQPREQKTVKLTIVVPKGAAGGGYYGAVRFSPAVDDGNKNVNLSASVGTLILLKVNGDTKEQMSVASFDVRQNGKASTFFSNNKNLTLVVRFKNEGNVQVDPFGTVILKKSGKVIDTIQVNNKTPRGSVLPDSIRRFDENLRKVGGFGKYTIEGSFGYGTSGQLLTVKKTFYVVPVAIILMAVAGLVVLLFLIFGLPRMIRAYNRRVIRRAGRRR
jgi:hypothetical protein